MNKRQIYGVIVCEDDAQERFIQGYLDARGYNYKRFPVRRSPKGHGSGKGYVEGRYVTEVGEFRRRKKMNASTTCALLVLIDWDTDRDPRLNLEEQLASAHVESRQSDEAVVVFAPRRSVETWTYHLLDTERPVDETVDYSLERFAMGSRECRQAGENFAAYTQFENTPPSLRVGCEERKRIPANR